MAAAKYALVIAGTGLWFALVLGCEAKKAETVTVAASTQSAEGEILQRLYTHRGTYGQALHGMERYQLDRGYGLRAKWARNEWADLGSVPLYLYDRPVGPNNKLPQAEIGAGGQPFQIGGLSEVDVVENFAMHRREYRLALEELIDYYAGKGDWRVNQAREEWNQLRLVRPYAYLQRAYIPGPELRPTQSIAEADQLYNKALDKLNELRSLPMVGFWLKNRSERVAHEGLAEARELVDKYPTSDKIADAAYLMGYFSGEYLQDEEVAVVFYERAVQWNPKVQHPAHFRAAILYDYRLHDRDRAVELYNETLRHEQFNGSNCRWAAKRIKQLTEGTGDAGQPPPPTE